ncbi:hypothetical protein SOVF_010420 [Spinacia oleracea]|nr:hypothetical protein SOVF_010420 [Spinacia oleracea]
MPTSKLIIFTIWHKGKLVFHPARRYNDDDEVVEIANPNPVVRAPTIEISSGSDMEPEVDGEVERVPHQYDIMNEDSDPEDDFDDPEDYDFTPESYRERNDRRDATSI